MMKVIFTILTIILTQNIYCQEIKIIEPEFSGVILFVNDSVGEGIRLEQQIARMETKSNAVSFVPVAGAIAGKARSKNVVNGATSSVIINKRSNVQFIISASDNSIDPSSIINIFKLVSENDKRTLELASASVYGGSTSYDIDFIKFKAKKYGTSSYLITIPEIELGEYAITLPDRRELFNLFSIQ